ncbi:MAG: hypothetical protein HY689_01965 [Chloroflexi bacterium]|nr:hypothetical protein [Chloroflexota bacterium]
MMHTDNGTGNQGDQQATRPIGDTRRPALRLAVGLGDPGRESEFLPALGESGDFTIIERCLAAEPLLACLRRGQVDAALVAADLHRLSGTVLEELARTRIPLVLLTPAAETQRWRDFPGVVVPLDADPAAVRDALLAAVRGERPTLSAAAPQVEVPQPELTPGIDLAADTLSLISVASGHGSPGRTTLALSLAAALGAVAPTVLVDADLAGPSVAAYLDADPTRNLYMLAHAEPESPGEWERAILQETQPLGARSPHGVVLCGVPKPDMRGGISARFMERLLGELRRRYRYVIVDCGADLVVGSDAGVHRTVIGLTQQVLLVASADLVGLWHARTALDTLKTHLQIDPDRVALVVNRHDRRYHHGRMEIEWTLGISSAALIPYDHSAIQRAVARQRPLVWDDRSRAARAVLDLAERVHAGTIVLPPEPTTGGQPRWRQWVSALHLPWPGRNGASPKTAKGVPDGDYVTPVG